MGGRKRKIEPILSLDEDFEKSDVKEGEMDKIIEEMSNLTFAEVVSPSNFMFYSILGPRDIKKRIFKVALIDPDYCDMRMLTPKNEKQCYFRPENETLGVLRIDDLLKVGFTEKQIDEIEEIGFFLQYRHSKGTLTMIPSKALMSTLCRRLGIGTITEGRNPLRDIYLASIMRDAEDFTLVYRKSPQGGHAKAFACFSTKYQHTPQKIVFDFMRLLSNMKTLEGGHLSVRQYRINHFITSIDFSLNELSDTIGNMKITPGVRMVLSDVGDASFTLQSILIVNGGTVLLDDAIVRRHNVVLSAEEMVADYETKAYPKLIQIMETLRNLESIRVKEKGKAVKELLAKNKFRAAFGNTYAAKYRELYISVIKNEPTSGIDVVLEILKIPGNIQSKFCTSTEEKVALAVGQVLMMDIERILLKW